MDPSVETSDLSSKESRKLQFAIDSTYALAIFTFEHARMSLVPSSDILGATFTPFRRLIPPLNPVENPFLYETFQHGGDIYEGTLGTFLLYQVSSFIPKLSERWKMGLAAGITSLGISAFELAGQTPDPLDTLAGIAGAAAFVGIHHLTSKLTQRTIENRFPDLQPTIVNEKLESPKKSLVDTVSWDI